MLPPFKNLTIFAGYVGNAPELRYTGSGVPVLSLRICAKYSWLDEATKERRTIDEWATAVFYRASAEQVAKRVSRGAFVHVEGRRQSRQLPSKGPGRPPVVTEIIVSSWHLVDLSDPDGRPAASSLEAALAPGQDAQPPAQVPSRRPTDRDVPARPSTSTAGLA